MGLKNTTESYGGLTRFIHWVTAALIVVLIPLGLYMNELDSSPFKVSLYFIHKSLGVFVLALTAGRITWTLTNPRPALLGALTAWERKLAHAVHGLFYLVLFGVPLTGWVMSSAHGYPVSVYGWFTLPDLVDKNHDLAKLLEDVHEIGAWSLVALLVVHIIGVIKHQGVYKDETLARMMPRRKLWFLGLPVLLALAFAPAFGKPLNGDQAAASVDDNHEVSTHDDHDNDDVVVEHSDIPRWDVDFENSSVKFVAKIEGAEVQGGFSDYDADIRFDPKDLAHSRVDVRINLVSVDSGNAERDDALRSPAWFNTDKYRQARFKADDFAHIGGNDDGGDDYVARGELEIRGEKQDVVLPFKLDIVESADGGKIAMMQGAMTIDRTAYGLGQNEWEDAATVGHNVKVEITLRAQSADDDADHPDDHHDHNENHE